MKLVGWTKKGGKWFVVCECECGNTSANRKADLLKKLGSTDFACKSCTMVRRNAENADNPEWLSNRNKALAKANAVNATKQRLSVTDKRLRQCLTNAKQRCENPNNKGYINYGGRGIEFKFADIDEAFTWVVGNIGYPPSTKHSLDRIDNNKHYEAGNLRWATAAEQANNKRAYKRGVVGSRIAEIQKHRPDLSYESIRYATKKGYSNEQIISKQRHRHFSTSV